MKCLLQLILFCFGVILTGGWLPATELAHPVVDPAVVFDEYQGVVAVEAEHFFRQTKTTHRAFYLTHSQLSPSVAPDGDPPHVAGASGGAYLEILPDTRRTHDDKLVKNENFAPNQGTMCVLHYKINVYTPGRYYVWVRALSTGSEDNGIHVGLDGVWPASGRQMQWCQGKHTWRWESKQRTAKSHCGEPHQIYLDIKEPGEHVVQFSMREDGFEFDKWFLTTDRDFVRPTSQGPQPRVFAGEMPSSFPVVGTAASKKPAPSRPSPLRTSPTKPSSPDALQQPRQPDGNGAVTIGGQMRQWHKVTLDLSGPYAHEMDNAPNPFTDYRMVVDFRHDDGTHYRVPGYFAADGDAANTSAESGTVWRANFAADRVGKWNYSVSFHQGAGAALDDDGDAKALAPYDQQRGSFEISPSDKTGRDFRAHGRLQYVGKHYLQFAGSKKYFLKFGADAPETLLAFKEFDNTIANKAKKAPLKSWSPHVRDWKAGDPTWQDGKGKGIIGAVNYLSGKGCNAFSFLTYNAGGDGDNVWPFIHRDDKLHYDCSKLDQWGILFDHGTSRGMYLHFKMQETENDDHKRGREKLVKESLDGGDLGPQRKLYYRELIARYGHNLALNWNLGEENTQTFEQHQAMIDYISDLDAYDHNIVIHTFPKDQEKVYRPLLGDRSRLTGASLQNGSISKTHVQACKWVRASANAGKPWVVAFDESGSAAHGQCPDFGYQGFDGHDLSGKATYDQHDVRKQTLWGTLMAGGAGCEYYFGYKYIENDLNCEDWRSRDQSWDYGRIAVEFFDQHHIPFWEMSVADELIDNPKHEGVEYCFAKPDKIYLVYLGNGGPTKLNLGGATGNFSVHWFNPRQGGELEAGLVIDVEAGGTVDLGRPPADPQQDWLVVVRRR